MTGRLSISIPQPCHESWAAMTPSATGRHCAACQKTVVDFTLKTDDEILAYLARAKSGSTCGRFAAGQLERPSQRVGPGAPTRWRAWLAAAVAVWSVRETVGMATKAQAPTEQYTPGKARAAPRPVAIGHPANQLAAPAMVVRGVVLDSATHEGLPGVKVMLEGTTVSVDTNRDGAFELAVPAELSMSKGLVLTVSSIGYVSQSRALAATTTPLTFVLHEDVAGMIVTRRAWPWHPRRFYYWSKYWLTRPFRRA